MVALGEGAVFYERGTPVRQPHGIPHSGLPRNFPLLPTVNRGSTFALRRPHSRRLSRWAALFGIQGAFHFLIRRNAPMSLQYCLTWGPWILHFRAIQELHLKSAVRHSTVVEAMGVIALLPICDSSFTCEDYNTYRAHP